jgi:GDP-L-fucose synthase
MKTMLVLGADGFVGSNCVDHFKDKYKITTAIKRNGDLRVKEDVEKLINKDYDVVIQAAATSTGSKDVIERPYIHVTDNAVMNSLIFAECLFKKVKHVIFPSCTVMYQSKKEPQKESDWKPQDEIISEYFGVGNTKVYLEKMCEFYSRLGKTKFTAIRHSNVYGPGDKFDLNKCHMIPALIRKVVDSRQVLEVWGDGTPKRDVLYIKDLINFIDLCLSKQVNKYELFNCGFGKAYSVLDIANMIMDIYKKPLTINLNNKRPNIPTTVILDCSKAKEVLDWEPKTSLEEGLTLTIDWYKNGIPRIN